MNSKCIRKTPSPMGALAPCALPVCDYSAHMSVLSRTHYHVIVCVYVCLCVYVPRETSALS